MQELPEIVKLKFGSVYAMLTRGGDSKQASEDLLPKATHFKSIL